MKPGGAVLPIRLCDTTLRDGEQAPGIAFAPEVKVHLARVLDRLGVAEIEAGTPACGGAEEAAVTQVAALGLAARVTAWCRMSVTDIDRAAGCGVGGVAIAVPSSDLHRCSKFGRGRGWVAAGLRRCVRHAKRHGLYVCAAFEDGSRADEGFLAHLARSARAAGADRLRLSDTVGLLDPFTTADRVARLAAHTELPLEFHAHNDFGLATANALAAARAGATHLSVTALGLGERAGNAALEEVALALERLCGRKTGLVTGRLPDLFAAVAEATGRPIPPGKPVAGADVFVHESGIHVAGILKNPETYEPYPPELVGATRRVALGKHTGRAALTHRLAGLGVQATGAQVVRLLGALRAECERGARDLGDAELRELWIRVNLSTART